MQSGFPFFSFLPRWGNRNGLPAPPFFFLAKIPSKNLIDTRVKLGWDEFCTTNTESGNDKMSIVVDFEIRKFPRNGLMREGEMILIMVSLLLILCVFFIMCILIIGKRAGHKNELLFIDSLDDRQGMHTFSSLPPRTRAELRTWVSLQPVSSAESTVKAMSL